jgi:amino acid permease
MATNPDIHIPKEQAAPGAEYNKEKAPSSIAAYAEGGSDLPEQALVRQVRPTPASHTSLTIALISYARLPLQLKARHIAMISIGGVIGTGTLRDK